MSTTRSTSNKKKLDKAIWYALKPMNAGGIKIENLSIFKFVALDMKGFKYHRLWGKWRKRDLKMSSKNGCPRVP
jgi:hypothetical protein